MMQFKMRPRRTLGRTIVLPFLLALTACVASPFIGTADIQALQTSQQFSRQGLDKTWAAPSGSLVAIQRSLGTEGEQIIGLANETTLDGDNLLWLRARVPDGQNVGAFRLSSFLSRIEGVPYPFTIVSDENLKSTSDTLGAYFYLEWRSGGSTNCVLAFRRVDGRNRILPRGTNVLEVMLRNCVSGSIEEALLPIQDRQIGAAAVAGTTTTTGGTRMISPLAAPPVE
jgi:hypothetical protein